MLRTIFHPRQVNTEGDFSDFFKKKQSFLSVFIKGDNRYMINKCAILQRNSKTKGAFRKDVPGQGEGEVSPKGTK